MKSKHLILSIALSMFLACFPNISYSAEKINLYINIFSRSITLKELEDFANYGTSKGFLKKILKKQNQSLMKEFLTKDLSARWKINLGLYLLNKIFKEFFEEISPLTSA